MEEIALALGAACMLLAGLIYFAKYTKTDKDDKALAALKALLEKAKSMLLSFKKDQEPKDK